MISSTYINIYLDKLKKNSTFNNLIKLDYQITSPNNNYLKYKMTDAEKENIKNYILNYKSIINEFKKIPKHKINRSKLNAWVNNQNNPSLQKAASLLGSSFIRVSCLDIINRMTTLAEKIDISDYKNSIVILGSKSTKSGYFFSILFMGIMYGIHKVLPLDFEYIFVFPFLKYGNTVQYIDIDDMLYTGSQTFSTLTSFLEHFTCNNEEILKFINEYQVIKTIKPVIMAIFIREYFLKLNLKYLVIRPFVTSVSVAKYNGHKGIPCTLIYEQLFPSFKEMIVKTPEDELYYKIIVLFFNLGTESASTVYFDHKIADIASCVSLPLISGYIPSSEIIERICLNEYSKDSHELIPSIYLSNHSGTCKFINFIDNCSIDKYFTRHFNELNFQQEYSLFYTEQNDDDEKKDINEMNKCPKPFYKRPNKIIKRRSLKF